MNRIGILERVQPVEERVDADGCFRAAFLHFTSGDGRACAVYAAARLPAGAGSHPAVLHLPGGTQTVDEADLLWWSRRGFACAALDWQHGCYPHHDPGRKSCWPPGVVMQSEPLVSLKQAILPLATEACGAVLDWLAGMTGVDAERAGCLGISWGGYLAWQLAMEEPRLRCAVPVFGTLGVLDPRNSCRPRIAPALIQQWRERFDPLANAVRLRVPVCWLSASNDFSALLPLADRWLRTLTVPLRRSFTPNCDHSLAPGEAALALAWMRRWLCDGPELPAEPAWAGREVICDRSQEVAAVETWWAPPSPWLEAHCWWPGEPPRGAWSRRFARVTWKDGFSLCSPLKEARVTRRRDPGATWPDLRAGLGWHWGLGSTKLHGNDVRLAPVDGGWQRVEVTAPRPGPNGILLYQVCDPGWNRRGMRGLRLRLDGLASPPRSLPVSLRWVDATGTRHEEAAQVKLDPTGRLRIDARCVPVLRRIGWRRVLRVAVNGIPGDRFVLGPLERIG